MGQFTLIRSLVRISAALMTTMGLASESWSAPCYNYLQSEPLASTLNQKSSPHESERLGLERYQTETLREKIKSRIRNSKVYLPQAKRPGLFDFSVKANLKLISSMINDLDVTHHRDYPKQILRIVHLIKDPNTLPYAYDVIPILIDRIVTLPGATMYPKTSYARELVGPIFQIPQIEVYVISRFFEAAAIETNPQRAEILSQVIFLYGGDLGLEGEFLDHLEGMGELIRSFAISEAREWERFQHLMFLPRNFLNIAAALTRSSISLRSLRSESELARIAADSFHGNADTRTVFRLNPRRREWSRVFATLVKTRKYTAAIYPTNFAVAIAFTLDHSFARDQINFYNLVDSLYSHIPNETDIIDSDSTWTADIALAVHKLGPLR